MNIQDFVKNQTAGQYLGRNPSGPAVQRVPGQVASGLAKAEGRIQTQVDSTQAQLSALGKLTAAVSGTQIAARALAGLPATVSSASAKSAVVEFVAKFNEALNAAASTEKTTPGTNGVGKVLRRAAAPEPSTVEALKKVGIGMNANGTLTLDATKLASAQAADPATTRTTLAQLGQRADKTTTRELDGAGTVGGVLAVLGQRAGILKSQQGALAALAKYQV